MLTVCQASSGSFSCHLTPSWKKHYLVRDVITDHIIVIRYGLPPTPPPTAPRFGAGLKVISNKKAELGFEAAWLQP